MEKYSLIPEQLLYEGTCVPDNFFSPKPVSEKWILQTHNAEYWDKLKHLQLTRREARPIGFPVSNSLVERERIINQGTLTCCHFALKHGISMNIAGGTHHAYADRGEGFCLLNDQAMAANYVFIENLAKRIVILDLDVHQGNGTAKLFQDQPAVTTISIHGEKNYPLRKEKSDWDIGLPDHTVDKDYLLQLDKVLLKIKSHYKPDFLFYQSGVDVLATDKLGRLGLTIPGCKERDRRVLSLTKDLGIPTVVCMGGGYSTRIADIVEAHANTFRLAQEIYF